MKITVFTSNQPRHLSLIQSLSQIADEVYAVQECTTVFPGFVDDFYKKSDVMQRYFKNVIEAEKNVFGDIHFSTNNVKYLAIKMGDLNKINFEKLSAALSSDYYIIFGASFIKSELINFLVEKKAINIHMGVSPYYRGSSCNFWALYDKNPEYVGATIHLLSKGLDSGNMLFHAFPCNFKMNTFQIGMYAVKSAHDGLIKSIKNGTINQYKAIKQNKALEIRYSRYVDFNDDVALEFMNNQLNEEFIIEKIKKRDLSLFLNPYIDE